MSSEPEFNSHYRCQYCDELRPRTEIIFVKNRPVCRGSCQEDYYNFIMRKYQQVK